jgi:hypothetical protein
MTTTRFNVQSTLKIVPPLAQWIITLIPNTKTGEISAVLRKEKYLKSRKG